MISAAVSGWLRPVRPLGMNNATKTVRLYLEEFAKGADGMPAAMALLSDDFEFDGPMLKTRGKAEFIEGIKGMAGGTLSLNVLKQFTEGDDVCSIYEFSLGGPAVVMAEWSHVRGGKIVKQRLVYDSAQMASP